MKDSGSSPRTILWGSQSQTSPLPPATSFPFFIRTAHKNRSRYRPIQDVAGNGGGIDRNEINLAIPSTPYSTPYKDDICGVGSTDNSGGVGSTVSSNPNTHHVSSQHTTWNSSRPSPGSIRDFFFGFLYEEDTDDNDDIDRGFSSAPLFHQQWTHDSQNQQAHESAYDNNSLDCIQEPPPKPWQITMALCVSLALLTAATSTVATLTGVMASSSSSQSASSVSISSDRSDVSTSLVSFEQQWAAQQTASAAIWGSALGKMTLGLIPDVYGARKTSMLYSALLCIILVLWGLFSTAADSSSIPTIMTVAFGVEFVYAVQWPCTVVVLGSHYRVGDSQHARSFQHQQQQQQQQNGIRLTSLSARCGSLLGIPWTAAALQRGVSWRVLAMGAAWCAALSASITYWFVADSVYARNAPQNPIAAPVSFLVDTGNGMSSMDRNKNKNDEYLERRHFQGSRTNTGVTFHWIELLRWMKLVVRINFLPSLWRIWQSGTFWLIVFAHTGSCVVRTSERLLGTYFFATHSYVSFTESTHFDSSNSVQPLYWTYERAASHAVWYSIGTVAGLAFAGSLFARLDDRNRGRKRMVAWLYCIAIVACYALAILAVPSWGRFLDTVWNHRTITFENNNASSNNVATATIFESSSLVLVLQKVAVTAVGFGVAVPLFHIPSLVGTLSFGKDKGLFVAYTDGVATALAAVLWRRVEHAMWQDFSLRSANAAAASAESANDNTSMNGSNIMDSNYYIEGRVWVYAWAAVALLLLLSAIVMVEFMEHYFVALVTHDRGNGVERTRL